MKMALFVHSQVNFTFLKTVLNDRNKVTVPNNTLFDFIVHIKDDDVM